MSHFSQTHDPSDPEPTTLRVLHLVKGLGPGGAERLLVNQLQTSGGGIEYTVGRLIKGKHHLVGEIEATGATTVTIGGGRFWPLALRSLIRSTRPDVVHVHSPVLAGAVRALRITHQIDTPVITTEHNRWPRHHWATRALNKRTASIDDRRIAVSIDVRDSMTPSIRATTTVLDHGVPLDSIRALSVHRDEMRARLLGDRSAGTKVIGIVANFRPEKAYDVFLHAVEIANRLHPGLRFLVVGQGPGEEAFRAAVATEGLNSVVEVLGYRDDAIMVMTSFDIFTLTSRHEGKPVSLMEAFALGIPAVCTRAGGIPEAIDDGKNGILVDIDDADGIARAWVTLANDDELLEQMAQAARTSAARFDASNATRSIESMYRDVVG